MWKVFKHLTLEFFVSSAWSFYFYEDKYRTKITSILSFFFLFLKAIFLMIYLYYVYKCSICMYTFMPEEGIRSHYR